MDKVSFDRRRFPSELIVQAVWLYNRFTQSFRDVEDLLAERGLDVSYETIRRWFLKFGGQISANLRTNHPAPSDHWHLDEMVIVICGRRHWLWRAVDNEGTVLDFLVQSRRNTKAASKLVRSLLKKQKIFPTMIVTDKLRSYPAAFRKMGISVLHIDNKHSSNRAENSNQPIRRRDRKMQRFKSPGSAQCFLNIHTATYEHFNLQRDLINRPHLKRVRAEAFDVWDAAGHFA